MAFYARFAFKAVGCSSEPRVELGLVIEADRITGRYSVCGLTYAKHGLRHINYACRCSDTLKETVRESTTHKLTTHSPGKLIPLLPIMWL